jgi:hypothetical protein
MVKRQVRPQDADFAFAEQFVDGLFGVQPGFPVELRKAFDDVAVRDERALPLVHEPVDRDAVVGDAPVA